MNIADILLASIPGTAILCATFYKIATLIFRPDHPGPNDKTVSGLETRVKELENRVATLQDIVLSGEIEARRRMEALIPPPARSEARNPQYTSSQNERGL